MHTSLQSEVCFSELWSCNVGLYKTYKWQNLHQHELNGAELTRQRYWKSFSLRETEMSRRRRHQGRKKKDHQKLHLLDSCLCLWREQKCFGSVPPPPPGHTQDQSQLEASVFPSHSWLVRCLYLSIGLRHWGMSECLCSYRSWSHWHQPAGSLCGLNTAPLCWKMLVHRLHMYRVSETDPVNHRQELRSS